MSGRMAVFPTTSISGDDGDGFGIFAAARASTRKFSEAPPNAALISQFRHYTIVDYKMLFADAPAYHRKQKWRIKRHGDIAASRDGGVLIDGRYRNLHFSACATTRPL